VASFAGSRINIVENKHLSGKVKKIIENKQ
jgi:hypothetical protein